MIRITSINTQRIILRNGSTRSKAQVARNTQDVEIQRKIERNSTNMQVLIALASNKDLNKEIEANLAERNNPRINSALLRRTEKE